MIEFALKSRACAAAILSLLLALPVTASASDDVAGNLVVVNDNGAWSWFEDERAIVDTTNGRLLVSSVANASGSEGSRHGDIDVATLDLASGATSRFVLRPALQADDHNSAALILRPDGKYLAMYGMHVAGGEAGQQSYYRISTAAHDSTSWNVEQSFDNNVSMTYSNLHYLPNDNGGAGRMYNFVRSNGFDPNILVSSNQGTTWTYGGRLLTEGGGSDRPYVRYVTSGDRIHLITTERHPRDFDNSIYAGYVQNGQLFGSNGSVVDVNLFDTTGMAPAALTPVFTTGTVVDGAAMRRAWTVDISDDASGNPVVVFQARANGNDTDHRFFYGRWNGAQWQVHQMGFAGSYLYAAENDYTGLAAIDPRDPSTVYLSSEVHPATKAQLIGADGLRHYELFRGQTADNGATWTWTPITYNSTVNNIRPIVPKWDAENTALLWLRGTYTTYTNYNTDVVALVNPELPDHQLALAVDFGSTGQTVQAGYQAFTRAANPDGTAQSEAYASPFAANGGQLTVTLGGGDVQFADRGEDVAGPLGRLADDFAFLAGDLTLTFGNLTSGDYQLVLYAHDRNTNQLTYDVRLNNAVLGRLNPVSGANPSIGIASSRVAFGTDGSGDVTFTLDGIGAGADVILNGFELYSVGDFTGPLPTVDLNADGELDLIDFEIYLAGLHTDLTGLTQQQAYEKGDLNADYRNDFLDYQLFRQAYDAWNGQGAFVAALAIVPEPASIHMLLAGMIASRWLLMRSPHASGATATDDRIP